MINKKLCVHSWHDRLISFTDYDERVVEIKENKPEYEQEIRLRVFKPLSKEAIKALPKKLIKAYADRNKADVDWNKAYADWDKANVDWSKAYADWKGKEEWHKKFCDCKEWNGKELVFD